VWRCEAPGGLQKAIKFVAASGDGFRQELAAFEQIKAVRHPFLLALDRVELCDGELVMVMELADSQLQDRFRACRNDGLRGIPRGELLGYLGEAAEALDMIGARYGLQHLDVKPPNLFLVAGHAKVGDYGLVRRAHQPGASEDETRGFTPRYTAPEVLLGRVDTRSDQYSLALVYAELLTGSFPFSGRTMPHLVLQHIHNDPDLAALPVADQAVVGRALAKNPAGRFASCVAFVRALVEVTTPPSAPGSWSAAGAAAPASSVTESVGVGDMPTLPSRATAGPPGSRVGPSPVPPDPARAARAPVRWGVRWTDPRRKEAPPPPDPFIGLWPVMPVERLCGTPDPTAAPLGVSAADYVAAVVRATARNRSRAPEAVDEGAVVCRFLCTLPAAMVPLKLAVVAERWQLSMREPDPSRLVLRRTAPVEPRKAGKGDSHTATAPPPPAGFEVVVHRPVPPSAEFTAVGTLFGSPDETFAQKARRDLPAILDLIRAQLQTLAERRAHPRFPADLPIRVYPLYPDGIVGEAVAGRYWDVSAGGVRFVTPTPIRTERLFVEFPEVEAVGGLAVYVRVLRTGPGPGGDGAVTVGRFRTGE
jgi:hypothetical protein